MTVLSSIVQLLAQVACTCTKGRRSTRADLLFHLTLDSFDLCERSVAQDPPQNLSGVPKDVIGLTGAPRNEAVEKPTYALSTTP